MAEILCHNGTHDLSIPGARDKFQRCRLCYNERQKLLMRAKREKERALAGRTSAPEQDHEKGVA